MHQFGGSGRLVGMIQPGKNADLSPTNSICSISGLSGDGGKGPAFKALCPRFIFVEARRLCRRKLFRCSVSQAAVRKLFVVLLLPRRDLPLQHRTGSEANSLPNPLPAAVRGSFRLARSAPACPAECAVTRFAVPLTTPENADWSVPARCRSGSPAVVLAPHPTLV